MNYNKHIWEGWTVQSFIDDLAPTLSMIQSGQSHVKAMTTKSQLKDWCKDNQSYYKKHIPEVVNYFASLYKLK